MNSAAHKKIVLTGVTRGLGRALVGRFAAAGHHGLSDLRINNAAAIDRTGNRNGNQR